MKRYDDAVIERLQAVLRVNTNERLRKLRDAARELGHVRLDNELSTAISEINGEANKLDHPLP